jgi:hypothetical protein
MANLRKLQIASLICFGFGKVTGLIGIITIFASAADRIFLNYAWTLLILYISFIAASIVLALVDWNKDRETIDDIVRTALTDPEIRQKIASQLKFR